jgi:hypothetical protein
MLKFHNPVRLPVLYTSRRYQRHHWQIAGIILNMHPELKRPLGRVLSGFFGVAAALIAIYSRSRSPRLPDGDRFNGTVSRPYFYFEGD